MTTPAGLRRNNPGNIRALTHSKWNGEIGQEDGFAVFDRMENGIRALAKQLLVYAEGKRKLDTIAGIIGTWAPAFENDTNAYVGYVCKSCELEPDDKLNLRDFSTLYWLTRSIGEYENGRQAFAKAVSEETLQAGVRAALA